MKKANKPKLVYWSTYISSYLSKIYFSNSELMIRKNIQKQNYFVFVYIPSKLMLGCYDTKSSVRYIQKYVVYLIH